MSQFSHGFSQYRGPTGTGVPDWSSAFHRWIPHYFLSVSQPVLGHFFPLKPQAVMVNLISLASIGVVYFPDLSADFLLPLTLNISVGPLCPVLFHLVSCPILSSQIESSSDRLAGAGPANEHSGFHSQWPFISLLFQLKKGSNWYWYTSILPS